MIGTRGKSQPSIARGWDVTGVLLAVLLSIYGVALTSGLVHTGHPHGYIGAAFGVLAMTLPVAWARRYPGVAATCLCAAAPINVAAFGSLVRCGATLPAVFYVAFCAGIPRSNWKTTLAGCLLFGSLASQAISDPKLGLATLPVFTLLAAGFLGCGRLVGQRMESVAILGLRNAELIEQRERSIALSLAIEREHVAMQLDQSLRIYLEDIVSSSKIGRESLSAITSDRDQGEAIARMAFADIEDKGRRALSEIRTMFTNLRRSRRDESTLVE
jgi:hypothetical protein